MKKTTLLILLCSAFFLRSEAQIDGDNIFAEDQIITIELTFEDPDFWNVLTDNYTTSTYTWADLTLTDNTGTYSLDSVGVRLKGNSSYSHPGNKKSFKIDFNRYIASQNYDGLKKLNFSNSFKDPSCIREKTFYDVCHSVSVPAPRSNFANVTMNGTPWGFYTVVEQIDDQFLDWRILDDDGNLFKAGDNFGGGPGGDDAADLLYYGADQASYDSKYELKSNEDVNDWSDLIAFIDFINNSTSTEFSDGLSSQIELTEYLRSAALDNLFSNLDSYTGSARNYYIYHNLSTNKWEWIKWDGNESFGSYTNGVNGMTNLALNYHNSDRPLLENIFDDPILYQMYLDEMCDITDEFFNSTYLDPRIDEIAALVQASVYADDNKMYTDANFDSNIESDITSGGGPGGGTIYGLKSFVTARNSFVTGELECVTGLSENEFLEDELMIYPNPTSENLFLESMDLNIDHISVFDLQGRLVKKFAEINTRKFNLNIQDLNMGPYSIQVILDNGQVLHKKFIKQ